ncbi:MAG TPA: PASTA domain-containing protein [Thermoleophilaceae bacterium]
MQLGIRTLALTLAAAAACALGAARASADTARIANPGPFTLNVSNGVISLGASPVSWFSDAPFAITGTAAPDGSFTTDAIDPPAAAMNDNSLSAGSLTADLKNQVLSVHLAASSGTLDPATGAATLTLPVYGSLTASVHYSITVGGVNGSGNTTASCSFASLDSPQDFPLSSSGSTPSPLIPGTVSGIPYNPADGSVTLVSGPLTTSDPTCSLGNSLSSDVADPIISALAGELRGSSNSGTVWMIGTFSPAFTAPVVKPPPTDSGTGTAGGGGAGATPPGGLTPMPSTVRCVVPKLRHLSLKAVRRKLAHNHCKLGKVTRRHSRKLGRNHVLTQKLKPGRTLPAGSAIPLTLSSGKPARHH